MDPALPAFLTQTHPALRAPWHLSVLTGFWKLNPRPRPSALRVGRHPASLGLLQYPLLPPLLCPYSTQMKTLITAIHKLSVKPTPDIGGLNLSNDGTCRTEDHLLRGPGTDTTTPHRGHSGFLRWASWGPAHPALCLLLQANQKCPVRGVCGSKSASNLMGTRLQKTTLTQMPTVVSISLVKPSWWYWHFERSAWMSVLIWPLFSSVTK